MELLWLFIQVLWFGYCIVFGFQVTVITLRSIVHNIPIYYFTWEMTLFMGGLMWFYIEGLPL